MSAFESEASVDVAGEEANTLPDNYEKVPESERLAAESAAATAEPLETATAGPAAVRFERNLPETMIDAASARTVIYCGICSMPPEFCEYGACYDRCRPWIEANCPEVLNPSQGLSAAMGQLAVSAEGADARPSKPRGGGAAAPRKAVALETRILISRVQRQKKKFVTVVLGLETIPDLKVKDAAKLFGKKFSSGASVGETATGAKEVTIQGDVSFDVPPLLVSEYKIDPKTIFFSDNGSLTPYSV